MQGRLHLLHPHITDEKSVHMPYLDLKVQISRSAHKKRNIMSMRHFYKVPFKCISMKDSGEINEYETPTWIREDKRWLACPGDKLYSARICIR